MENAGNTILTLQLANYASNRIYQISPYFKAYHSGWKDENDPEYYTSVITFDEYRKSWPDNNWFDYCSQFFEMINDTKADDAARYAERISKPKTDWDRFLNERGYVDSDYIYDIVCTIYLREMKYDKAVCWLSKVSTDYQARTNIAKDGYFKLDPFKYQFDKKHFISDSSDYKLRFTQEMTQLENTMNSDAEPIRKADAKIRFSIGLRNSFGKCWYLTQYGFDMVYESNADNDSWEWYSSIDREGFYWNVFAQKAYKRVDTLIKKAVNEYTNREKAAQAQLEMMNFNTIIKISRYSRCSSYSLSLL